MNFKQLLQLAEASRTASDSFRTTGEAMAKDKAKSGAPDAKAKDAARKRAERAKQVPRERKSKGELVKEVIAVKTASGRVQLIFKDSFNKDAHTKLNKGDVMTEDEAKQFTSDPNFEQTRASTLLFGNLKMKEEPKEKKKGEKEEEPSKKSPKKEQGDAEEKEETPKAKRLSKEEIMQAMLNMTPEQLASMPPEVQQDFFERLRSPMAAKDFDNLTFENLTTKFGINTLSSVPYNQQVLNALLFVAKIKAGASDQEMQTLVAQAAASLDFTKGAFLQASKILSQIGDQCIQNLVSSIESGQTTMYAEGAPELECGDYRFKVSAGGEFTISTNSLNQSGKIVKGIIGNAISKAFMDPEVMKTDPNVQAFIKGVDQQSKNFGTRLLPDDVLIAITKDPNLAQQFQQYPVISPDGKNLGMVLDKNGNINPAVSVTAFENQVQEAGKGLFKKNKSSLFMKKVVSNVLKSSLRGDDLADPKKAPNHVITVNGIFPITDDYIEELSKTAKLDVKKSEESINNENISYYKKSALQNMQRWRTVVEQAEEFDIEKLFVDRQGIDPLGILVNNLMNSYTIDINASLLPGFKPEEINAIEYNYVRIGGKTTKIPVVRNEKITSKLIGEDYDVVNEMIIESLTNNFLLSHLCKANILTDEETTAITKYGVALLQEEDLRQGCLVPILNKVYYRFETNLQPILNEVLNNIEEEYKRNYKKEYRNYHGKPKQRKQRAARTKAREMMIKKGMVKKGDGIDIDHKKPLRSGGSNGINNLRKRKKSDNRADNGHKKGEKQDKDWK